MKQMKDPGTTGNFEVTVDGKLIHSKKHQGLGSNLNSDRFTLLRAIGFTLG